MKKMLCLLVALSVYVPVAGASVAQVNTVIKKLISAGRTADIEAMRTLVTPRLAGQADGFHGFPWMNVAAVCSSVKSIGPTTITGDQATVRVRYDPAQWFKTAARLIAARAKLIRDPEKRAKALAFVRRFSEQKHRYRGLAELEFQLTRVRGKWLVAGLKRIKSGR
jgi:hypothetical protein